MRQKEKHKQQKSEEDLIEKKHAPKVIGDEDDLDLDIEDILEETKGLAQKYRQKSGE